MSVTEAVGRGWSPRTEGVLRRVGWRPGRSVPTSTWEAVLSERGSFAAHEAARRFLSEFGGLVTYGWPADTTVTSSAIRFDPLAAAWQDERFAWASREVGASVHPVGTADEGASFLGTTRPCGSPGSRWCSPFRRRLDTVETGADAGRRWPVETDRVLRAGGWYPGRSIPTETWESLLLQTGDFEMHDAARRFLSEFGAVGMPYRDMSAPLRWAEFQLDPLLALFDAEIIHDLAEQVGVGGLCPLGMRDRGNQYLAMADDGTKVPPHLLDKDTGRVKDAKEELERGLGMPVFRESDGPAVARKAQEHGLIPSPRGRNRSYADFVGDLTGWT
ncbi:SUKH-3 domain-containing protein [Streptomyces sp. NPDC000987]|uniref:SUKH-3 domain-containing protein n=1 Tax=Streptomyces sp. NPDC000987 TaxID=3154374 RepID=UPI0033172D45